MATIITGTEREPFEHFDIAFLGYNNKLTDYGLRQFIENNQEEILKINWIQRTVFLKDGTMIKGLLSPEYPRLSGHRFDQLILFDDDRWLIEWHRKEEIRLIKELTMHLTNVPEEFQLLKYKDIR